MKKTIQLVMGVILGLTTEHLSASERGTDRLEVRGRSSSSEVRERNSSESLRVRTIADGDVRASFTTEGHFVYDLNMDRRIAIMKAVAKNPDLISVAQRMILIQDGEAMAQGWDTWGYANFPTEEEKRNIEKYVERLKAASGVSFAREHTVTDGDVRASFTPEGNFVYDLSMDRRIAIMKAVAKKPDLISASQRSVLIQDGEAMAKGWDTSGYGNFPTPEQIRRIEKILGRLKGAR